MAELTTPDGERGRKLSTKQAAERAEVARSTWADYTRARPERHGRLIGPAPDGREEVSGTPWWYEATVDAWLKNRIGQGRRRDLDQPPGEA
jgi:hypothetical protein